MTGCSSLYAPAVAKFEYDEEARAAWRLDVVHDVRQDKPVPVPRWIEAMRRLNAIRDPLARQILVLDRECGSGTGACDNADDVVPEIADRLRWGCETTEVIAASFPPKRGSQASRNSVRVNSPCLGARSSVDVVLDLMPPPGLGALTGGPSPGAPRSRS
jgi:hypothetical protein